MSSRKTLAAGVATVVVALAGASFSTPAQSAVVTCAGVPATIVGTDGADALTGTPGDGGTNGTLPVFESGPEPAGDTLVPGPGDDLVDVGVNTVLRDDGWNSPDTIDYSASATGVSVDLGRRTPPTAAVATTS